MIAINEIIIGERARKDMGDLNSLAESIKQHGLLHPVVITSDMRLVAGHRRMEAAKLLGWDQIPVTVVDVADLLSAERDENQIRKDFTPTEAVAIGRMIEEKVKAEASERKREKISAARRGDAVDSTPSEDTRVIVGKAVGMSGFKYEQAKKIIEAAESEPEKFGDLPEKMDQTGNVNGAFEEMKRRKEGLPPKPGRRGIRSDKDAPYEPKTERQRIVAEAQKSKMVNSLSIVTGHCRGLEELDVQMALSVCSDEEIKVWKTRASEISKTFRELSRKLQRGTTNGSSEHVEAGQGACGHAGDSSACAA